MGNVFRAYPVKGYPKHSLLIFAALALSLGPLLQTSFAAREYQVGVSPLVLDLGEIKPGEERVESFYIVTGSTEELLVKAETFPGSSDFFKKPEYAGLISNYSEEDASSWVAFPSNPVVLSPQNDPLSGLAGKISGWRRVNFALKVPKNAEPGYHVVSIRPVPYVASGRALGVNIVAISKVTVLFRVPGNAVRAGQVLDITAEKYGSASAWVNVFFKNTGTVTVLASAGAVEIYNGTGTIIESSSSGTHYIKSGATESMAVAFGTEKIPAGTYDVSAKVQYLTGSATKSSSVSFVAGASSAPPISKAPGAPMPWWVLAVPVLLFLIVYFRGRKDKGYKV